MGQRVGSQGYAALAAPNPNLRWNQEIWGEAIKQPLSHPLRWLDSSCGWRLLGKHLEPLENELVSLARTAVGVGVDWLPLSKPLNISERMPESVRALTQPQPYSHLFAPAAFFKTPSRACHYDAPGTVLARPCRWFFGKSPLGPPALSTPRKYDSSFAAI
jgi:hypothetical protein